MNDYKTITAVSADPRLDYTRNGLAVATIPTANVSSIEGRNVPAYRRVRVFGKRAENLVNKLGLKTGDVIHINGRVQQSKWTTQDGQKRNELEVIGNSVTVLDANLHQVSADAKGQALLRGGENQAEVIGNLTKDTETVQTSAGIVVKGSVAVNEWFRDRNGEPTERTHFIDFEAWDDAAMTLRDAQKGRGVLLRGPLVTQSWDGNDGRRRYKTLVKVTKAEMKPGRTN